MASFSMADLLIFGGDVVTADGVLSGTDVAVAGGQIVAVGKGLTILTTHKLDATGLAVFPGVIDSHVHFNEPGRTEWEGFDSGSAALSAGGGSCFFEMPLNASPPTLDKESFDLKLAAALAHSRCDFGLWGGLTPGNLDKLEELADRGVVGFKAFMSNSGIDDFRHSDDWTLFRGMRIAAGLGLPVAVHAENDQICGGLAAEAIAAGKTSWRDYVASRPVMAEVEAIQRAVAMAEATGCKLHIVHVSSHAGASIAHSSATGADVTWETCPHYWMLTEDDLFEIGARAKCAPPLRHGGDVETLKVFMHTGECDFVASDHSPAPASMKTGDNAFKIWGGIAGVQSTLPAVLTAGLPPQRAAALTAANVAGRYRIPRKGKVEAGYDADLCLVRLGDEYELKREMLLDRHKLSPYVGMRFRGRVVRTLVRGETVFADGKVVREGGGRLVRPERESNAK